MSKLVVIAVLVLAAVATADAFRSAPNERALLGGAAPDDKLIVHHASSALVAVASFTGERVLRNGREYLSAEQVASAFPGGPEGLPVDIGYVAGAADGTVALGVYRFRTAQPVQAGIELWRNGELLSAFRVPAGAVAGGLGFAHEGRYVAGLSRDGLAVYLFTRRGRPAGTESATSW